MKRGAAEDDAISASIYPILLPMMSQDVRYCFFCLCLCHALVVSVENIEHASIVGSALQTRVRDNKARTGAAVRFALTQAKALWAAD